ncbi:MAG TPA: serine/threonine-protein kinase [Myxococcaceae bacterium]|nr:serine/threonine-protein kinase [Myxococcaceae bacterium]
MHERDLIVGVLAVQAGFASPSQVLTSAAAGLVDAAPDSLLTRLERAGALTSQRRKVLETLVEQADLARKGNSQALVTSPCCSPASETLSNAGGIVRNGDVPAVDEIPVERPGQYTRLHELGRGSQSVVRVARDEIVGREVALKELLMQPGPPGHEQSCAARARFIREVRLVASLDHPGIVSILEFARRKDGTLFCAQKLIRGETLQSRLTLCRTLASRIQLLRSVLDACEAMGFAHSRRVIHRDLKPSNVMVGECGETVVIDWGLAKHQDESEETRPLLGPAGEAVVSAGGSPLGTPAYMSPEQARGDTQAVDTRSDVFSLGAILYQLLTGRPPFEGATSEHILERVRTGEFHPVRMLTPDAPPELAAVAERALRLQPSDRYRDAGELAAELRAYLTGGQVRAYRYSGWELIRKLAASHRALTAGVAAASGALLVAALVAGLWLHGRPMPAGDAVAPDRSARASSVREVRELAPPVGSGSEASSSTRLPVKSAGPSSGRATSPGH